MMHAVTKLRPHGILWPYKSNRKVMDKKRGEGPKTRRNGGERRRTKKKNNETTSRKTSRERKKDYAGRHTEIGDERTKERNKG